MDFIISIFRSLLFFFDQIIYIFIPRVYNFIQTLANRELFTEGEIESIATNIYAILGVFMLFRIAFVLLNSIIDPDKLTDNERGAGKILSRLIVAIVLVVTVPFAFDFAFDLQKTILEKDVINKIIIGKQEDSSDNFGNTIGKMTLGTFINCRVADQNGKCEEDLQREMNAAFPPETGENVAPNFDGLSELVTAKSDDGFTYTYSYGISTICGGFILALLITFCFDIAVRLVKLGFLQLISPIAIIGYIEPKGTIFSKWLKLSVNTYINLFTRLITISFVVYIIRLVAPADIVGDIVDLANATTTDKLVNIFIIIGALIFAKEAPKMISNMLGIEEGTIADINPFKKLNGMVGAGAVGYGVSGAAKLGAGGLGAVGGAVGSKLRGGSLLGGAKAGFEKGAKGVKMGPKLDLKNQGLGLLKGAGAGGVAGFKSDTAIAEARAKKEQKMQDEINKNGNDASVLFENKSFRDAFTDMSNKKEAVKTSKKDFTAKQNEYSNKNLGYTNASNKLNQSNNQFTRASQALATATSTRDFATSKAAELKRTMDEKLATGGNLSTDYLNARNEYNSYTTSAPYTDSMVNYTTAQSEYSSSQASFSAAQSDYILAQSELATAQSDLQNATDAVATAEREYSTAETAFNVQKEATENKKDAETYKAYKTGKDAGRIK